MRITNVKKINKFDKAMTWVSRNPVKTLAIGIPMGIVSVFGFCEYDAHKGLPRVEKGLKEYVAPNKYNSIIDSVKNKNKGRFLKNMQTFGDFNNLIEKFKEQARLDSIKTKQEQFLDSIKNVGAIEYKKGLRIIK